MSVELQNTGWELYQFPPSFVLGFHGCDESIGEAILRGETPHLRSSKNDYDWLGNGIYFWEANPQRALEFARERAEGAKHSKGEINSPFVLGAIINLSYCLDLRDSAALNEVRQAYDTLVSLEVELPDNGTHLKLRRLDCAVFNYVHQRRLEIGLKSYDTVRATYREGVSLYPGTDLSHQDHTQICVCSPDSILGYFRPIRRA